MGFVRLPYRKPLSEFLILNDVVTFTMVGVVVRHRQFPHCVAAKLPPSSNSFGLTA